MLPGPEHQGPVTTSGARPIYKKNGLFAWGVTHALLIAGFYSGVLSASALYERYGEVLATLALLAFPLCTLLYFKAVPAQNRPRPPRHWNRVRYFRHRVHRRLGTSLKRSSTTHLMKGWSAFGSRAARIRVDAGGCRRTARLLGNRERLLVSSS